MWFEYSQNNSGGSFDYNPASGISVGVYIEADTAAEADKRAEFIGLYFDGVDEELDCECCGDRWYRNSSMVSVDAGMTFDEVQHSISIRRKWSWHPNGDVAFLHFKDGSFIGTDSKEFAELTLK